MIYIGVFILIIINPRDKHYVNLFPISCLFYVPRDVDPTMESAAVPEQIDLRRQPGDPPSSSELSGGGLVAKDARAVANYLLARAKDIGMQLTPMQLIKLVYIAHGWNLAVNKSPLFHDPVEAWRYGPVVPSVYQAFKAYGRNAITRLAYDAQYDTLIRLGVMKEAGLQPIQRSFSQDEVEVIDVVLESYGQLGGLQLSSLTHQDGTPWSITIDKKGQNALIDSSLIEEHFTSIVEEPQPMHDQCKNGSESKR